jgi:hypothetical protein
MYIYIYLYMYVYILFGYNLCRKKYYFSTSLFGGKCRDIDMCQNNSGAQKNKDYFLFVV